MALSVITMSELLRGVDPVDVERITPLFVDRRYPRGGTVFAKGDAGDALFMVKEGIVKLVSLSGRGTETILHILPPGAIFGEILLSEERRAFSALAGKGCVVAALPKPSLVRLLGTIPAFSMNFVRLLSRRLAKVETEYAGFGHTWSYHRLALILLQLAEEHGVRGPAGTILSIRLTHEELANLIGTTRETVTTQMGRFRTLGLAHSEGKHLRLDVPGLVRFLREDGTLGRSAAGPGGKRPLRRQ
ncbi:MAG: Crp/Fnr family transcriptional regulator [Verrucomicrobiota bacterium]